MSTRKLPGRTAKAARPFLAKPPADALPPHSEASERAALGCVILAGEQGSQAEVDALLMQLKPRLFYTQNCADTCQAMLRLRIEGHAVDQVTVARKLKDDGKHIHPAFIAQLPDDVPSLWNFPTYLDDLKDKALRRWTLQRRERLAELAHATELTPDMLRAEFGEIFEAANKIGSQRGPVLVSVGPAKHAAEYQPTESLCLVGSGDISKGYQGVTVIAGPPGSGKSLSADALAIAGAIGSGYWMGRKVHRRFRTLIIQCENGAMRVKMVGDKMRENFPHLPIDEWIQITLPPEAGLAFHRAEFRQAVAALVRQFKPDVVIIDPWTAVAADDMAKDIIDKLAEIRTCFPAGDECPALVIVAHTKKPRIEDKGNRGRALMYSVSGSQALVSTARAVFVVLPFTDDIRDDRILFACAKLSDARPEDTPADTVWHRRLGNLFQHCGDNPEDFWTRDEDDGREKRKAVSREQLREIFGERLGMDRGELCKALVEREWCSYQTARRITGPAGYMLEEDWLKPTPGGLLAIQR